MSSESSRESPVRRKRRRRPARQRSDAAAQASPRRLFGEGVPPSRMQMVEEFQRRVAEFFEWLQKWYSDNYEKVDYYDQLRFEILCLLGDYLPGIRHEDLSPSAITGMLKAFITELITKFNRFNIDLHQISGHEVAGLIQDHNRKVLEVVEDYENKLKDSTEEAIQNRELIAHLDAELTAARKTIKDLQRATAFNAASEDIGTQQQFVADLQARVIASEQLNSSMGEVLQRERQENGELQRQLGEYARDAVVREEGCIQNALDFSRRTKINSMLLDEIAGIIERSGIVDPSAQDCQEVVERWTSRINQTINQNAVEIEELLQTFDNQIKQMTELEEMVEWERNELEKLVAEEHRCFYLIVLSEPRFQMHKILWVAVPLAVELHVERRRLQIVGFHNVVSENQR
ncbi:uncharacterized protein TNCT_449341 [Trichonephila clavata]|uniref:Uncharacterized protein n=1 Tax=Trichonephila clavata TaxID=2740835 RepID=A0A8X6FHT0_TRICU|nr:uncharacterized protein TNCT_449341 [Trichonephila clavata]